jgi:hypothetical protein
MLFGISKGKKRNNGEGLKNPWAGFELTNMPLNIFMGMVSLKYNSRIAQGR